MNKNTKIRLNYLFGLVVSALLLWAIWVEVKKQLGTNPDTNWWQHGDPVYLVLALLLLPLNLGLEAYKWQLLAGSAQPLRYWAAFRSYLAGLALSVLTPNRIGEYPGRMLYLKRKNTIRLISVSMLGVFAQFLTVFIFGIAGLIYYNIHFPGYWPKLILAIAVGVTLLIALLFFRFEQWASWFDRIKWLKRFQTYHQLLKRFSKPEQLRILLLSLFRFLVYCSQYLLLLQWMNIDLSLVPGYFTAFLFFWSIAVIPSFALAELGIRGQVSIFLFHHYTENTIGVLSATIGLWCLNLVVPAIIGSILLVRLKWWRST